MSGFSIDFNPLPQGRLQGIVLFALGAVAFAIGSDQHFKDSELAERPVSSQVLRPEQKKPKHIPQKLFLATREQRALDSYMSALSYDWNPVLDELEAAAGSGTVVQQFTHKAQDKMSAIRLESRDPVAAVAAVDRIKKILVTGRKLRVDSIEQGVRDGIPTVQVSVAIFHASTKENLKN